MAEQPALHVTETDGVTVVSFANASILDVVTIQKVGGDLYKIIEDDGKRKVVLDFAEVRFLSSQALGVMLTLRRKAEKATATIAVSGLRPELARVFEITNLDKLFEFYPSSAEAITTLSQR